jgi:hypothetical protein
MDATEIKLLELIQAICRLHRYEQDDASYAVDMVADEGFENVSVEFAQAIYDQLKKEVDERTKIYHNNAENKLYYKFVNNYYKSVFLLSERYFLLDDNDYNLTDSTVHDLKLFDLFNDKSV